MTSTNVSGEAPGQVQRTGQTAAKALFVDTSGGGGGGGGDASAANQVITNTKLDTLHTDLGTTLAGYLDGLEGFVDGLETLTGAVTETAPASDTASSGLNGRLQRLAQRVTSLNALFPTSLGAKTSAGSLSTATATDDLLLTVLGAIADAAWTSGSGSSIALLKAIAAAAISTNPVQIFVSNSYNNITTKTTTVVKSGAGTFARIVINKTGSADTLVVYDNTAGSGTVIASLTSPTVGMVFSFDCAFATGLTIVTGGTTAGDYTVIFR